MTLTAPQVLIEFRRPIAELEHADPGLAQIFRDALQFLVHYIGRQQFLCLRDICTGEERAWSIERLITLAEEIKAMPVTYEQDGKGEDAIVHLHYFGAWDWYVTERDKGSDDDAPEDKGKQQQAFGLVNGHEEELGYISIEEILNVRLGGIVGVELDLHWKPKPVRECRKAWRTDRKQAA
jgi:hypothetical protein